MIICIDPDEMPMKQGFWDDWAASNDDHKEGLWVRWLLLRVAMHLQ